MSRVEKEECVIRLYKENKSTREIAKLMHMSFWYRVHNKEGKVGSRWRERPLAEDDDIK